MSIAVPERDQTKPRNQYPSRGIEADSRRFYICNGIISLPNLTNQTLEKKDKWKKQEKLNQYPNQNIRFEPRFASLLHSRGSKTGRPMSKKNKFNVQFPNRPPERRRKKPLHIRHEKHREMTHELRK
jgi:hypothetical protein